MKKSAFTLIELLVVISIIAILASIAVPVFTKAIESGKATTCLANQKQLATGAIAYLSDNDDEMFASGDSWPVTLHEKYVPNWKVFRCPFDKGKGREDREGDNAPVSYGVNRNLFGISSAQFGSASDLILFSPAPSAGADLSFSGTATGPKPAEPGGGPKSGTHNNRSRINVAYADGHASTISALEHSTSSGEEGRKRWFPTDRSK